MTALRVKVSADGSICILQVLTLQPFEALGASSNYTWLLAALGYMSSSFLFLFSHGDLDLCK